MNDPIDLTAADLTPVVLYEALTRAVLEQRPIKLAQKQLLEYALLMQQRSTPESLADYAFVRVQMAYPAIKFIRQPR